jgi:hypothetical protein
VKFERNFSLDRKTVCSCSIGAAIANQTFPTKPPMLRQAERFHMKVLPAQFEGQDIRRTYDEATEIWWFSIVDVVQVLTQQADFQTARKYWNQLKRRLEKEGRESVTNCHRLKLPAADGKHYLTDVTTAQTLRRLAQSIPSPKAEPIKLWLAKVGYERMTGQETRNKLTDYWPARQQGSCAGRRRHCQARTQFRICTQALVIAK